MWNRIISGQISLKEIEERFDRFREHPKSLDVEIKTASTCFSDEEDIETVLHRRIRQIRQCQKLTECSEAAQTILDFQEAMGLEGDFRVLEDLRDQVNALIPFVLNVVHEFRSLLLFSGNNCIFVASTNLHYESQIPRISVKF